MLEFVTVRQFLQKAKETKKRTEKHRNFEWKIAKPIIINKSINFTDTSTTGCIEQWHLVRQQIQKLICNRRIFTFAECQKHFVFRRRHWASFVHLAHLSHSVNVNFDESRMNARNSSEHECTCWSAQALSILVHCVTNSIVCCRIDELVSYGCVRQTKQCDTKLNFCQKCLPAFLLLSIFFCRHLKCVKYTSIKLHR